MKRKEMASMAIVATLLLLFSGCIVAEGPGRRQMETYYYYPDHEVYYYPRVSNYYWFERGEWRHGPQPPPRVVLRDRERVRIDSDHDPHTDHERIKKDHQPGRYDSDERREDRGGERRDDRR